MTGHTMALLEAFYKIKFNFWNVHGIMKAFGLLQVKCLGFTLTLQETQSIHDFMNRPKIVFIVYIYIILYISKI